ncbi:MAG: hypothetical protein HRU32_13330 [Rhodobacteraceae bacterium]|nr:hypothetical protein [Paracoccaceae bacterium]
MKKINPWLFLFIVSALVACSAPGDQTRDETDVSKQGTEKVKANQDTTVKTTKPTPLVGGDLTIEKDGKLEVTYEGAAPQEVVETHTEKSIETSSFMDFTLREVHEKLSAWYWLILVGATTLSWRLYRTVVNSKEFAAVKGGLKFAHGLGSFITGELKSLTPGTPDHTALTKIEGQIQSHVTNLQAKANPRRPFHG